MAIPTVAAAAEACVFALPVAPGASVHLVHWSPVLRQIFAACADGQVRALFDPDVSVRGVLLSTRRHAPVSFFRAEPGTFHLETAAIVAPFALPLYRDPRVRTKKRKTRETEYDEKMQRHIPELPITGNKGRDGRVDAQSKTFVQHVYQKDLPDVVPTAVDVRAALLAREAEVASHPLTAFVSKAYSATQPDRMLLPTSLEAELEAKKREKLRRAGLLKDEGGGEGDGASEGHGEGAGGGAAGGGGAR